jgi:hypothetical protein
VGASQADCCIAIITERADIHGLAVQRALGRGCHIVEVDRICEHGGLQWTEPAGDGIASAVCSSDGHWLPVEEIDLIWFRRCFVPQTVSTELTEGAHIEAINGSTPQALLGLLLTSFRGAWISHPTATRLAENKLVQLRAARGAGLATPRTLISNRPEAIRQFCAELDYRVVVKPIRHSLQAILLTQMLRPEHLESDDNLRLCPAIYQEYIPGNHHLRIAMFGERVWSMLIEATDLDWRVNLDVPCRLYELDELTVAKLRDVLRRLDLSMGVFDLKLNGTTPTWLEVNPQGQFIFAEGLTGAPVIDTFSEFLRAEANAARAERCW